MTTNIRSLRAGFPALRPRVAGQILISGAAGLVAWELFARLIAPLWLGFPLDPTGLIQLATGISGSPAEILHLLTGLVLFPAGYVVVAAPLLRRVAGLAWFSAGAAYGVALWIFAMYVVASLLGGMPPFMGFGALAWASLAGHVLTGLAMAAAAAAMRRDA